MEKLNQLKTLLEEALIEGAKFHEKGNKAAGTRVRAAMQAIKALAQEIRKDVQEAKKA